MGEPRRVEVEWGVSHPETGERGVAVRTPYLRDFVQELKGDLAAEDRRWVPGDEWEEGWWWVSIDFGEYAEDLVVHHFGETRVISEDAEEYHDRGGTVSRQERLL